MPIDAIDSLRSADLLPGWYEDWVLFEQERLRQQRLDALEALARRCLERGDTNSAKDAATAAIAIEPLRESAHLLLVRSHLAEGNRASATRVFHELRNRLRLELGITPGHAFTQLLQVDTSFGWPASSSRSGARARGAPSQLEG